MGLNLQCSTVYCNINNVARGGTVSSLGFGAAAEIWSTFFDGSIIRLLLPTPAPSVTNSSNWGFPFNLDWPCHERLSSANC